NSGRPGKAAGGTARGAGARTARRMGCDPGAALTAAAGRFQSQLLSGSPAPDPVTATERLLAVQAQDRRGARLAIRARTSGCAVEDFDRALTDERSLLVSWL